MRWRGNRILRIAAAAMLFCVALVGFIGNWRPSVIKGFLPSQLQDETGLLAAGTEYSIFSQGIVGPLGLVTTSKVSLSYPASMLEDETKTVQISYAIIRETTLGGVTKRDELEQLPYEVRLSLHSSGFQIDPDDPFVKKDGVKLPIQEAWTITPKAPGERDILVRIEEPRTKFSEFARLPGRVRHFASLNGQDIPANPDGRYMLHVSVKNFWGVSPIVANLLSFLIAGLGFVLLYPVVSDRIKTFLEERRYAPPKR